MQDEMDDYNNKLWNQMMDIAREGGKWDLAKPLREEIVEEYKEDDNPKQIRSEYLQEMTVLVIDMSIPTIQRIIDQMTNYKSIKILIITGGEHGAPVDLNDLLRRGSAYPLQSLNIINFKQFVTKIPKQINTFDKLTTLGLFNNNINQLPDLSGIESHIDSLFLELNPISTLLPSIGRMSNLKKLGVAKTSVSEEEIREIKKLLPNCKIQTQ